MPTKSPTGSFVEAQILLFSLVRQSAILGAELKDTDAHTVATALEHEIDEIIAAGEAGVLELFLLVQVCDNLKKYARDNDSNYISLAEDLLSQSLEHSV